MKKLLLSIFLVSALVSCTEEPEIWDSATLEYAGNWQFQLFSADGQDLYVDYGYALYTYNTAANIPNEIWIDDETALFPMKFKATLDGTSGEFLSVRGTNIYGTPVNTPGETDTIETVTMGGDYSEFEVVEGHIIENASLMTSGVYSDSLYMKIKCYLIEVDYTSYIASIDSTWDYFLADSTILTSTDSTFAKMDSVYGWESTGDTVEFVEEYVISGYRYTGYSEDEH